MNQYRLNLEVSTKMTMYFEYTSDLHSAIPKYKDEKVYPDYDYVNSLKKWCKEFLGQDQWNYYGRYHNPPCQFTFKRSEDLLAFKLTHDL